MAAFVRSRGRRVHSARRVLLALPWAGRRRPHRPSRSGEGDVGPCSRVSVVLLSLRERDLSPEAREAGGSAPSPPPLQPPVSKQTARRGCPCRASRRASCRAPSRPPSGPTRPPGPFAARSLGGTGRVLPRGVACLPALAPALHSPLSIRQPVWLFYSESWVTTVLDPSG